MCEGKPGAEKIIAQCIKAARETQVFPFWPSQCQRWAFKWEENAEVGKKFCTSVSVNVVAIPWPHGGGPRHTVILIRFCDGQAMVIDNGTLGGGDHIVDPSTITREPEASAIRDQIDKMRPVQTRPMEDGMESM